MADKLIKKMDEPIKVAPNKQKKPLRVPYSQRVYKKDPVGKVIRTTENLTKFKTLQNTKLLKILERIELDRPILMKEKVDVLWNQYNEMMPEMQIVRS